MRVFILIASLAFAACSSPKKTESQTVLPTKNAPIPSCILSLIDQYKSEPKQNPPRSIYSYTYNDSTVYYVPSICCDQYSSLFNKNCELIAHPDGGFTGKGDGKLPDFAKKRTDEKLIWHDERE